MSTRLSNTIVNSLPPELHAFRAKLAPVSLPVRMSLYEAHEVPKFAHFLTSGIASVTTTMQDGGSVETGMWARDGVAECMHLGGSDRVPTRCFMQIGGTPLRISHSHLGKGLETLEPVRPCIS